MGTVGKTAEPITFDGRFQHFRGNVLYAPGTKAFSADSLTCLGQLQSAGLGALDIQCVEQQLTNFVQHLRKARHFVSSPLGSFREGDKGVYIGGNESCAAALTLCLVLLQRKGIYSHLDMRMLDGCNRGKCVVHCGFITPL